MRTPFFSFPAFVSSRCASLVSAETATRSDMCAEPAAGRARPARELYTRMREASGDAGCDVRYYRTTQHSHVTCYDA